MTCILRFLFFIIYIPSRRVGIYIIKNKDPDVHSYIMSCNMMYNVQFLCRGPSKCPTTQIVLQVDFYTLDTKFLHSHHSQYIFNVQGSFFKIGDYI